MAHTRWQLLLHQCPCTFPDGFRQAAKHGAEAEAETVQKARRSGRLVGWWFLSVLAACCGSTFVTCVCDGAQATVTQQGRGHQAGDAGREAFALVRRT